LHHAEPVAGESRELIDRALGIYRYDELAVLRTATMPAVLFEAG
jgi:N-acetylmuramoyl-L-alanine amidase